MMKGIAPFGTDRRGKFNFEVEAPKHVLYFDPSPKKIRAVVGGATIVETTDAKLLHETGQLPVYYLPLADVRDGVLEATDHHTHCPFKGEASYYSITTGGDERENAAWSYPEPTAGCPPLAGHVAFYWDAVDEWWEEAERVYVHARDPYHRIDVIDTDRHVVVRIGGEVIADSGRATMLFETGLPPRFYVPEIDVDRRWLVPSDTRTECPYKGKTSRYYSISAGGQTVADAVWVYDQPLDAVRKIAGKLAFYDERVELTAEGGGAA